MKKTYKTMKIVELSASQRQQQHKRWTDQDSRFSFESDSESESIIPREEEEEEEWIEYIQRSSGETEEKMRTFKVENWLETKENLDGNNP